MRRSGAHPATQANASEDLHSGEGPAYIDSYAGNLYADPCLSFDGSEDFSAEIPQAEALQEEIKALQWQVDSLGEEKQRYQDSINDLALKLKRSDQENIELRTKISEQASNALLAGIKGPSKKQRGKKQRRKKQQSPAPQKPKAKQGPTLQQKLEAKLSTLNQEIKVLKAETRELTQKNTRLLGTEEKQARTIKSLSDQNSQLKEQLLKLEATLKAEGISSQREIKQLTAQLRLAKKKLADKNNALETRNDKITALTTENKRLQEELALLHQDSTHQHQEDSATEALRADVKQLRVTIQLLSEQMSLSSFSSINHSSSRSTSTSSNSIDSPEVSPSTSVDDLHDLSLPPSRSVSPIVEASIADLIGQLTQRINQQYGAIRERIKTLRKPDYAFVEDLLAQKVILLLKDTSTSEPSSLKPAYQYIADITLSMTKNLFRETQFNPDIKIITPADQIKLYCTAAECYYHRDSDGDFKKISTMLREADKRFRYFQEKLAPETKAFCVKELVIVSNLLHDACSKNKECKLIAAAATDMFEFYSQLAADMKDTIDMPQAELRQYVSQVKLRASLFQMPRIVPTNASNKAVLLSANQQTPSSGPS